MRIVRFQMFTQYAITIAHYNFSAARKHQKKVWLRLCNRFFRDRTVEHNRTQPTREHVAEKLQP